jgi:endonuclease/exonuclease/phosphatase (EEP) superfamily protein YafD
VIDTHLHHLEPDSGVRQEQVQVLLDFWAEEDYTIVLGDLNAEPNSTEIRMIADSGLLDAWSSIGIGPGFTFSSSDPTSRIDWIWHTSELQPIGIEVIQTQASDHMPVLASFEVKP